MYLGWWKEKQSKFRKYGEYLSKLLVSISSSENITNTESTYATSGWKLD